MIQNPFELFVLSLDLLAPHLLVLLEDLFGLFVLLLNLTDHFDPPMLQLLAHLLDLPLPLLRLELPHI